jgi:triosephosphate isomerase
MEDGMRKLAAGNWKMNGTGADLAEVRALIAAHPAPGCDMLICPPATLIQRMAALAAGSALMVGGQDCHAAPSGAHTGDISAAMLREAGARWVILGHSERRADHVESDALVRAKAEAALAGGLGVILCLGETQAERAAGRTLDIVGGQLDASFPTALPAGLDLPRALVIAYEPVWAIGSGLTPSEAQIVEVHGFLRARLTARLGPAAGAVRLLYGGSVKPANAAAIFALPDVDGALVGGASLRAADFAPIVAALAAAG